MKYYTLWQEGYAITGNNDYAKCLGNYPADTFNEAVERYVQHREETDWPDIRKPGGYTFTNGIHSVWGCRIYNNEVDARKSFG